MKFIQYLLATLSITGLILFLEKNCISNDKFEYSLVISNGVELKLANLIDNAIKNTQEILDRLEWTHALYPCFNAKNNELFFEAENLRSPTPVWIYAINLSGKAYEPRKIVEGQAPSINTNYSMLSYYKHPHELWVVSFENGEKRKIADDIGNNTPAVWFSEYELLYRNKENKLVKINGETGAKKDTGIEGIDPSAFSPKIGKVLCSADGRKIYLYSPENNNLELIKEFKFLSVGRSFVFTNNGDSFLYTRQTLFKQLQINEGHDLFICLLNGNETKVLENVALFGGVFLPD